ncbi:MAG: DnaJ domain-containing protein [Patescibacteria group bacterium]
MAKDYYNLLGVGKNASKEDIKLAFRKLAHKYHPDKKDGDEAKFKEVNEAYQTLSDDKKRAQYDQFGSGYQNYAGAQQGGQGFGGFDYSGFQNGGAEFDFGNLNDIFSDFFGGGMGGGRPQARQGRDISTEMTITFTEALLGVEKRISINKVSNCDTCKSTGAKPGTKMNTCKKCNGQGQVREIKKSFLGSISSVRLCDECLGEGKIPEEKCETCKGAGVLKKDEEIKVIIPSGILSGETIRINAMGEAVKNGKTGDLYINIKIKKPGKLSKKAIELIEKLKEEGV